MIHWHVCVHVHPFMRPIRALVLPQGPYHTGPIVREQCAMRLMHLRLTGTLKSKEVYH